jgi:hypothetical protein
MPIAGKVPPSHPFARVAPRRNRNKRAKRIVHRLRIRESLNQFRVKERHVSSPPVSLDVLTPNAPEKSYSALISRARRLEGAF